MTIHLAAAFIFAFAIASSGPNDGIPLNLDWIGPTVTAIGTVLVALVGGASLFWRRKQDAQIARQDKATDAVIAVQPTVTDGWEEVRQARMEASSYYNLYRAFENLFYSAFGALRFLARKVHDENPAEPFDQIVLDGLALIPPDTHVPVHPPTATGHEK